jgi:tetratricopeptide (TPR) repeat protein
LIYGSNPGEHAESYDPLVDGRAAELLLDLAERIGPGMAGLDRESLSVQLEGRHDFLLAVMQWFVDQGRTDEALRVARALAPFWTGSGRLDEGSYWFGRVLAADGGQAVNRGRACFEAGLVDFWRGADDRAAALHHEALAIGRRIGDPTLTALALTGLARLALRSDDISETRRLCHEALSASEEARDPLGRASALHVLGVAAQMAGDLADAREFMTERMALARQLGQYGSIAAEASNLSMVELQLGHLDQAEDLAREALDIDRRRNDEWAIPYTLMRVAQASTQRGDFQRAATIVGAAEAMVEKQGATWPADERPHYDRTVAKLADAMGSAEFGRARASGQSLATDQAIELALRPLTAHEQTPDAVDG